MRSCLITGGAGFIGSHLASFLLAQGWHVAIIDNFDSFYPRVIKERNIQAIVRHPNCSIFEADIRDVAALRDHYKGKFNVLIHLAAKAGVRESIIDPVGTQNVNVIGTQTMLELAKEWGIPTFIFASSSSVYGVNPRIPWCEDDPILLPISPYSASKISGELLGQVYSRLYGIRFIALRFFTVYGPRQRPDLAIHKFARLMKDGRPIPLFGDGQTRRDYTSIEDIVAGIAVALDYESTGYEAINLGSGRTASLVDLVSSLERVSGIKAKIEWRPLQPGDVFQTYANIEKARCLLGYTPKISLDSGLEQFWRWIQNG